ncbi:MAG: hypothetical protein ACXWCZ_08685 [Flavisolibacter sp.]
MKTRVDPDSITVVAGDQYHRGKLYRWLWGDNRRAEWTVPVRVPVVYLDTLYGGLTPYKIGGGNETSSLRLRSATGKEYAIRSINKSRLQVIPRYLQNTFIGCIIQDGVSMSHPYAAVAITKMLQSAGIYHTTPRLVYLPRQNALDTFNTVFGNKLFLLEQRPDGDWSDAPHLGNFDKFYSTIEVLGKIKDSNHFKADQKAYIKSRLFDILVSDWDRHHDNWKWGIDNDQETFVPIPRDRDQAFFTRNGKLNNFFISVSGLRFMQNFDYSIKSVEALTSQDRKLDKSFSNEIGLTDWLHAAKNLQQLLTDTVIEQSILQLPPEVFAISGKEIIEKLKARRNKLHCYATEYYKVLAKKVEIVGSEQSEHFDFKKLEKGQLSVQISRIDKHGKTENFSFYHRIFFDNHTKVITVDGLGGDDVFQIPNDLYKIKVIRNTR